MTERLTLTVEEAAALLGLSRGSAYEAVRRGDIPTIRLGRRILAPRARLLELVGITDATFPPREKTAPGSGRR